MTAAPAPTAFTELVGCRLPIQQAGMGGVSTSELAAAVAREGALGMIGAAGLPAEVVAAQLAAALDAAGPEGPEGRVGVNFLIPFLDLRAVDAVAQTARVVEAFYGDPDTAVVERAHRGGALAAWQVGSVAEAVAAEEAGCDFVVVQGREAGGHVRGREPLLPLLEQVRLKVRVPIVAAGGIGSAAAMAEALAAGADAVRIGTRLLATAETDVHPDYAAALIKAGADDTVLTETFSMGWPHAPHRVLRACIDASRDEPANRSPSPPTRDFMGDVASAAMYAGQSVSHVRSIGSAASVIRELLG
jgi:NAD(P)H-dependent flavin oxidoreductase YrpB (nitropropane dioxygenase family)